MIDSVANIQELSVIDGNIGTHLAKNIVFKNTKNIQILNKNQYIETVKIDNAGCVIVHHAFSNLANLRHVDLSQCTTEISEYAFDMCPKLEEITIPPRVSYISETAFDPRYIKKIHIHNPSRYKNFYSVFPHDKIVEYNNENSVYIEYVGTQFYKSKSIKRTNISTSIEDFVNVIRAHAGTRTCILEKLSSKNECRLFFDVDYIPADSNINEVISYLAGEFGIPDDKYALTLNSGSHHSKFSYHIYFPYRVSYAQLAIRAPKIQIIDRTIYTNGRLFRCVEQIAPLSVFSLFDSHFNANDKHVLIHGNIEDTIIQYCDTLPYLDIMSEPVETISDNFESNEDRLNYIRQHAIVPQTDNEISYGAGRTNIQRSQYNEIIRVLNEHGITEFKSDDVDRYMSIIDTITYNKIVNALLDINNPDVPSYYSTVHHDGS